MNFEEYCKTHNLQVLLNEWSDKNGYLTPKASLCNSQAKIWWSCFCGNNYRESIVRRLNGIGCPKCSVPNNIIKTESIPKYDLTGKRFGKLTVISFAGMKKESTWLCKCDCGKETNVTHSNLISGKSRSCGCLQEQTRVENFNKSIHFIEGTCIEKIAAKTTNKNNTSGFRGVTKRANGTYRASLNFKGKRYDLGTYQTLEEAKAARIAGETIYDDFLNDFYKNGS